MVQVFVVSWDTKGVQRVSGTTDVLSVLPPWGEGRTGDLWPWGMPYVLSDGCHIPETSEATRRRSAGKGAPPKRAHVPVVWHWCLRSPPERLARRPSNGSR